MCICIRSHPHLALCEAFHSCPLLHLSLANLLASLANLLASRLLLCEWTVCTNRIEIEATVSLKSAAI